LREINWDTMGFNFVILFAPGTLENAPHSVMATISMPEAQERLFSRAVANNFPGVSAIRVKEVVETVAGMLGQLSVAVRSAASVAILAGIAVLVGALAASRRARIYDSVMLKLLGATRGRILLAQALEFGLLSLILAAVAFGLGAGAGWYVVVEGAGAGLGAGLGRRCGDPGDRGARDPGSRPARIAAGAGCPARTGAAFALASEQSGGHDGFVTVRRAPSLPGL
jgi:hypothetical protein